MPTEPLHGPQVDLVNRRAPSRLLHRHMQPRALPTMGPQVGAHIVHRDRAALSDVVARARRAPGSGHRIELSSEGYQPLSVTVP